MAPRKSQWLKEKASNRVRRAWRGKEIARERDLEDVRWEDLKRIAEKKGLEDLRRQDRRRIGGQDEKRDERRRAG